MPEQDNKNIKDYFTFIKAVFSLATKCWTNGEGKFEVSVSDEKGDVEGALKGGPTWRSKKAGDDEE